MHKPARTIALAAVLGVAMGAAAVSSRAQQGRPVDYDTVQIKTTRLTDTLSVYQSVPGMGNVVSLSGPDGVLIVDSMNAQLHDKLLAAIRATGATGPIRYLVNTHLHGDHTGGNPAMVKEGAVVVGQDNMLRRMLIPNANGQTAPAAARPTITYSERMTLHFDGEDVELIHAAPAHTDGDTLVFFRHANVLHVGDLPASIRYNNIGVDDGGTIDGMIADGEMEQTLANADTRIISGHTTPVVSLREVKIQTEMFKVLRDRIGGMIRQGKTLQQVIDAKPTKDFDEGRLGGNVTPDRLVGLIYTDMSRRMGKSK